MTGTVVIIDDNKPILDSLRLLLNPEFDKIICLNHPDRLPIVCRDNSVDAVILDMNFSGGQQSGQEGLYWLSRIHEVDPDISVVFITAYGEVDLAVEAIKRGATDFITKPWSNDRILATLKSSTRLAQSKKELNQLKNREQVLKSALKKSSPEIIGESVVMQRVNNIIAKVAKTEANILILGENGVGKELVAQQIHQLSSRNEEPMITVDLGAIPEQLFESELFGHTKGSFTDARETRIGKFEAASGGSLFFDEIGNLPLGLQAKLLTSLQNREIVRLGSNKMIPVNIRLISATNRELGEMVADGLFREDLLFRINTIVIEIPPLRNRGYDIIHLARHFLHLYGEKYRQMHLELDQSAEKKLLDYSWPGNVRELQHSMEKAAILSDTNVLSGINFELRAINQPTKQLGEMTLEEMESNMIQAAIDRSKGNISAAAQKLGITRQTLYNKLKRK